MLRLEWMNRHLKTAPHKTSQNCPTFDSSPIVPGHKSLHYSQLAAALLRERWAILLQGLHWRQYSLGVSIDLDENCFLGWWLFIYLTGGGSPTFVPMARFFFISSPWYDLRGWLQGVKKQLFIIISCCFRFFFFFFFICGLWLTRRTSGKIE